MEEKLLRTPLYECHLAAGGKIVPFAGYELPVQYEKSGVIAEHMAVREKVGMFDVSHMGEVIISGPDALANIQMLMTNDYSDLADGFVRYSPMCYANGGVVDDLLVYKLEDNRYFIVVNASNRLKDVAWMQQNLQGDVQLQDISDSVAQIALQGPLAEGVMKKLAAESDIPQKNYTFTRKAPVGGILCLVSRTGYTGEDGFELYCGKDDAPALWNKLLEAGEEFGLIPCGLGARDTLRMEAAMPLYGHEMDETVSPWETGLGWAVKMAKEDFIGKAAIEATGRPRARVGLKITGRGIVREHCDVYVDGKLIGHTTSGTHCPYLGVPVAMALIDSAYKEVGAAMEVDVRGRKIAVEVVKLPFYKREK